MRDRQGNARALKAFIEAKRVEGRAESTLAYYRQVVGSFDAFTGGRAFQDVRSEDVRSWMSWLLSERGIQPSTLAKYRQVMISFFRWLRMEGRCADDPMSRIGPVKVERRLREPFTPEEVGALRAACRDRRESAIVDLLLVSAVRVSELVELDREGIDFDNLRFQVAGKGRRERMCYLDPRSAESLSLYLLSRTDADPALFVTDREPVTRVSRQVVERVVAAVAQRAGVPRAYPHRFRRTAATTAIRNGMPVEQVQAMLGHSSIDTTMIYVRVVDEDVAESHRRYLAGRI